MVQGVWTPRILCKPSQDREERGQSRVFLKASTLSGDAVYNDPPPHGCWWLAFQGGGVAEETGTCSVLLKSSLP